MDTFDLIVVIMWSRLLYLHGRKSNTTSSPAFSRDICRMFPQNIWKLNQHRSSLWRESLYLIHRTEVRGGKSLTPFWKETEHDETKISIEMRIKPWNWLGLDFAQLRERLIISSPSRPLPGIILSAVSNHLTPTHHGKYFKRKISSLAPSFLLHFQVKPNKIFWCFHIWWRNRT